MLCEDGVALTLEIKFDIGIGGRGESVKKDVYFMDRIKVQGNENTVEMI